MHIPQLRRHLHTKIIRISTTTRFASSTPLFSGIMTPLLPPCTICTGEESIHWSLARSMNIHTTSSSPILRQALARTATATIYINRVMALLWYVCVYSSPNLVSEASQLFTSHLYTYAAILTAIPLCFVLHTAPMFISFRFLPQILRNYPFNRFFSHFSQIKN